MTFSYLPGPAKEPPALHCVKIFTSQRRAGCGLVSWRAHQRRCHWAPGPGLCSCHTTQFPFDRKTTLLNKQESYCLIDNIRNVGNNLPQKQYLSIQHTFKTVVSRFYVIRSHQSLPRAELKEFKRTNFSYLNIWWLNNQVSAHLCRIQPEVPVVCCECLHPHTVTIFHLLRTFTRNKVGHWTLDVEHGLLTMFQRILFCKKHRRGSDKADSDGRTSKSEEVKPTLADEYYINAQFSTHLLTSPFSASRSATSTLRLLIMLWMVSSSALWNISLE